MALTRQQCAYLDQALLKVPNWYEVLLDRMHARGEPQSSDLYLKTKAAWNAAHALRIHCMTKGFQAVVDRSMTRRMDDSTAFSAAM